MRFNTLSSRFAYYSLCLFICSAFSVSQAQADSLSEPIVEFPSDKRILFWPQELRTKAFQHMEKIEPVRKIAAGDNRRTLAKGEPLALSWEFDGQQWDLDSYMQDQNAAGVVILQNGKIRAEEYRLGFAAEQKWTSFSVAKSFTSTLVGAAIKDGYIKSIDAPITDYIPELKGSGYDGVTVKQILTMQSGVQWNEDYTDPNADVAKFQYTQPIDGLDPTVVYMRNLKSEAQPGARWQYNTGETNLIGVLVARATGKYLADYLSEKIWQPYGMSDDAIWMLNAGGREISGCCISARVRDYAMLGMLALQGGVINGESIVPEGWFASAGTKQADIGVAGFGYGYQWWTTDDGSYEAKGIFGQGIFVDESLGLVIASNSSWEHASDTKMKARRHAFYVAVQAALREQP
jgi:CubicO group peptidase (beta-lactamase class C family)